MLTPSQIMRMKQWILTKMELEIMQTSVQILLAKFQQFQLDALMLTVTDMEILWTGLLTTHLSGMTPMRMDWETTVITVLKNKATHHWA